MVRSIYLLNTSMFCFAFCLCFLLSKFRTGVSESKSNKRIQLRIWSKCDQIWYSLTQISFKKIVQFDCVLTVQRNENTLYCCYTVLIFCYLFRVLEFKSLYWIVWVKGGGEIARPTSKSDVKSFNTRKWKFKCPNGIHLCSFCYEIHKFRIKKLNKLTEDILNHAPSFFICARTNVCEFQKKNMKKPKKIYSEICFCEKRADEYFVTHLNQIANGLNPRSLTSKFEIFIIFSCTMAH